MNMILFLADLICVPNAEKKEDIKNNMNLQHDIMYAKTNIWKESK